jgi:hypothetical protein
MFKGGTAERQNVGKAEKAEGQKRERSQELNHGCKQSIIELLLLSNSGREWDHSA